MATSLGEGKILNSNQLNCLKIDLVSHLTCVEELVNTYIYISIYKTIDQYVEFTWYDCIRITLKAKLLTYNSQAIADMIAKM